MAGIVENETRVGEVLEAAAAFYTDYLWTTELGEAIRARISREGVDEEMVRAFGVGYVPGEHGLLEDHLAPHGFSAGDLFEAGIASRSRRGRVHSQFRSRIMFPIRDVDGTILGFAGMATNPGPSWPLWLISPDRGRFDKRTAIFAFDRAAPAMGEAGRAVVFRDCLDALRAHGAGRCESVALIRSSITPEHVEQIAGALGVSAGAVALERRDGPNGLVIRPNPDGVSDGEGALRDPKTGSDRGDRSSGTELRPDPMKVRTPVQRVLVQLARIAFGLGIPLLWLAIIRPDLDVSGGADPALVGAIVGVTGTYIVLAIVSAISAARVRARSRGRRMRGVWAMGAGEWQPLAWTYHMLEEILFAAALISAGACVALWVAIGGFTN